MEVPHTNMGQIWAIHKYGPKVHNQHLLAVGQMEDWWHHGGYDITYVRLV